MSARLHILRGTTVTVEAPEPRALVNQIVADETYVALKADARAVGLVVECVPNFDDKEVAVMAGVDLKRSQIYQGLTMALPLEGKEPNDAQAEVMAAVADYARPLGKTVDDLTDGIVVSQFN